MNPNIETLKDRKALALMPKGVWFRAHELARVVSNVRMRCQRLASFGRLEERIARDSVVTREYRVKNGTDGAKGDL